MPKKLKFEGNVSGVCRCCGQMRMIPDEEVEKYASQTVAGEVPPDLLDWLAMMNCNCDDARIEQHKQHTRDKAKENVRKLFEHEHPSASDFMLKAIDLMVDQKMGNMSIQLGKYTKANITKNAKGEIKVKRTVTKCDELEA